MIDDREIEWARVSRAWYLVQQRFTYEYETPITDLHHRLMVVPPARHGDQRTVLDHVVASVPGELTRRTDAIGNLVIEFRAPRVESRVDFDARVAVVRSAAAAPARLPASCLSDPALRLPSTLTASDERVAGAAAAVRARAGADPLALAAAAALWVHGTLRYQPGVTGVRTTAEDALALGAGVCQDYAHVMLAICRLLGLPARYVSGHLPGEGGTHAWVEVLVPDRSGACAVAVPFDPTNGAAAGMQYVTVATGRDYRDVAPTSGAFAGRPGGRLTASQRVDVTRLEYAAGRRLPTSAVA